ncbi:hypothetical protein JST97_35345 [bacterium]|nr:hypothetical protein [bacterium]
MLLLFWLGYGVFRLPPIQWELLLQEQRSIDYYSRSWKAPDIWICGPQAKRLLLDRGVVDNRLRALQEAGAYNDASEWLLIYLGYRLQGLSTQQISELPQGGLILVGALVGEAKPPRWAQDLAASLSPHPHGTFRLGLLSAKDLLLIREDSPQVEELKLQCMLFHDLAWTEAERIQLLSRRKARLEGHDALCLQAAIDMRAHLLERLALKYPPGSELQLQIIPPRRSGGRASHHFQLLMAQIFRSLGYRVDPENPSPGGLPLRLDLDLRLSTFEQLHIQQARLETTTTRRAVTRAGVSKYGRTSSTHFENQSDTRTVLDEKVQAASVPTLWVKMLGEEFVLPPFGVLDSRDLERIERIYAASRVEPDEWWYWDYNLRWRASAPWRYGLEECRPNPDY